MPKPQVQTTRTKSKEPVRLSGPASKTEKSSHPHKSPNQPKSAEGDDKAVSGSSLPMVSTIDDSVTMKRAVELLKEAERLKKRRDEDTERLDEIKGELGMIADAFSMPGFRWGGIGFSYLGERTNKRLDIAKLIEAGVDPELIRQSYTQSKPFIDSRLISVHG